MLRYKALQILKTFSLKDLKEFKLFLSSPFYNNNKSIIKLYDVFFNDFCFEEKSIELNNENILKLCNIKKHSTLRNLFAKMYQLTEKFIEIKGFNNNSHIRYIALLEELMKSGLTDLFYTKYNEINKLLSKSNEISDKDFYLKFAINDLLLTCKDNVGILKSNNNLEDVMKIEKNCSDNLFIYSLINFIKFEISILSHSASYNLDPKTILFHNIFVKLYNNDEIKELIDKFCEKDIFSKEILNLYFLNLLFRTTEGESAIDFFIQYSKLLKKYSKRLSIEESYYFYKEFIWICMFAMKYTKHENIEFQFYDILLKNKGFKAYGKDYMNYREFKHFLTRGSNTFRYEWTNNFIKKYLKYLPEEYRDTSLRLYKMNIYLRKDENPQRALDELNGIKSFFSYDTKRDFHHASIMCCFDLGRYDEVIYRCDSFRHFLKNQKIGKTYADPFKKFISYLLQITKLKINKKSPEIDLKTKIKNDGLIAGKLWLLEKLETFKK